MGERSQLFQPGSTLIRHRMDRRGRKTMETKIRKTAKQTRKLIGKKKLIIIIIIMIIIIIIIIIINNK